MPKQSIRRITIALTDVERALFANRLFVRSAPNQKPQQSKQATYRKVLRVSYRPRIRRTPTSREQILVAAREVGENIVRRMRVLP